MKLKSNKVYFVWFAYKNHPTENIGIPADKLLRFQHDKPEEKEGVFWTNIGMVGTDKDGNVPFFRG